jgi:hypothetical protein
MMLEYRSIPELNYDIHSFFAFSMLFNSAIDRLYCVFALEASSSSASTSSGTAVLEAQHDSSDDLADSMAAGSVA